MKGSKIKDLYNDILNKVRPEEKIKIQWEVRWKAFGENDKYTIQPILDIRKEVKGDFIKKATLEQMKNRQNYKGPEKEAIQSIINNMKGDTIIKDFAIDQLKQSIMPLEPSYTDKYAWYNKLYEPKNAYTLVYEAPFETNNNNHFNKERYFSHVRIEWEGSNKVLMELQSDLMQHKWKIEYVKLWRILYELKKSYYENAPTEWEVYHDLWWSSKGRILAYNISSMRLDMETADVNSVEALLKIQKEIHRLMVEWWVSEWLLNKSKEAIQNTEWMIWTSAKEYDTLQNYKNEARMRRTLDETVKTLADDWTETLKIPYWITIAMIEWHYNAVNMSQADISRVIGIVKSDDRFLSIVEEWAQDRFPEERDNMMDREKEELIKSEKNSFFEWYWVDLENNSISDPAMFEELIDLVDDNIPPDLKERLTASKNNAIKVWEDYSSKIKELRSEYQTVANFYEKQLIPYVKKMYPGWKDVEYNWWVWYEINIWDKANKPLKVFKRAEKYGIDTKTTYELKPFYEVSKEARKIQESEILYTDAKKISKEEYINKYSAEKNKYNWPHSILNKYELEPSEYENLTEMKKRMETNDNAKQKVESKDIYNKFAPILVERDWMWWYYVLDGHHRFKKLLDLGEEDIPVVYSDRELNDIWTESNKPKKVFKRTET